MKISSKDVIQANTPERVMLAIQAIARGQKSDHAIASAIGGLVSRQGRYYRLATEVLGFTKREGKNDSVLTELGRQFINANDAEKRTLFIQAFLGYPLVARLLQFLESHSTGATQPQLESFLRDVAALGTPGLAHRRVSSYISWLREFGLLNPDDDRLILKNLPDTVPMVTIPSDEEPIFPKRYELKTYEDQARRVRGKREAITFMVDQAKHERAAMSHEGLVKMMAERIKRFGAVPKRNRYMDLSASMAGKDYIFEMKSTTEGNVQSQVRRGVSQLYEYRYLQNVRNAKLVLVMENKFPKTSHWLIDYLINDRNILPVWDGNGEFTCPEQVENQLPFLN